MAKLKKIAAVALLAGAGAAGVPLTVVAVQAARAGETPEARLAKVEREAAELRAKVADLEQQLKTLQLLVNRLAEGKAAADPLKVRREACARADALAAEVRRLGAKAPGSEPLAALVGLCGHEDREVRAYTAALLGRLPKESVSEALARTASSAPFDSAAAAAAALREARDGRAREAVAERCAAVALVGSAPDYRDRERFVLEACSYLVALGEARGVSLYMKHLADQLAELKAMRARGVVSLLPELSAWRNINEMSRLSGYGVKFPQLHVHDGRYYPMVYKFAEWWEANKANFKELRNAELREPGEQPRLPERF